MDEQPGWRQMFDAWNEQVGPRLEQLVRTEAFADQAAGLAEFQRQWMQMVREFSDRMLRVWNIPSASDVAGIKRQIEALDRQLTKLTKTLQEAGDASELKRNG